MERPASSRLPARVRRLLAQLGDSIGRSVDGSSEVADAIRRIQAEGFHLYLVLDAKIGVDRDRKKAKEAARRGVPEEGSVAEGFGGASGVTARSRRVVAPAPASADFRMNLGDALLLRSLGIDGTLRIRRSRPLPSPLGEANDSRR